MNDSTATDPMWPKGVHVISGWLLMFGVAVQVSVGVMKYRAIPAKVHRWHGALGLAMLGVFNVVQVPSGPALMLRI